MTKDEINLVLDAVLIGFKAERFMTDADYALQDKAVLVLQEALAEQPAQQEPVDSTQISKVWWDGEKLMAKPIPFVEFYKPAQRTWVGLLWGNLPEDGQNYDFLRGAVWAEAKLKEKNT